MSTNTTLLEPFHIRALRQNILWYTWRKESSERALASADTPHVARVAAQATIIDAAREIAKLEAELDRLAPAQDI